MVLATIAVVSWLGGWSLGPIGGAGYPQTAANWLQVVAGFLGLWAALTTFILGVRYIGYSAQEKDQRRLAASAEQILTSDTRPPVLYLRSFDDDVLETTFVRTLNAVPNLEFEKSAEQVFSEYLTCIGPVIAIGRPGEKLPELGFARLYVEQEKWQSRVLELIDRASLVVLRAGHSPGVQWETAHVLSSKVLPRVVVLVPWIKEFDYDKYRDQVRRLAAIDLPGLPKSNITRFPLGVRAIIRFQPNGDPCLCAVVDPGLPPPSWIGAPGWVDRWSRRRGDPWFRPQTVDFGSFLVSALRPVFAAHSLAFADPAKQYDERWRPTTVDHVTRWVVILAAAGTAGLLIFAVVILFISGAG